MKNIFLAFIIFTFCCACSSSTEKLTKEISEEKAIDAVKTHLKKTMNNPTSYESDSFTFLPVILKDSIKATISNMEMTSNNESLVPRDSFVIHQHKLAALRSELERLDTALSNPQSFVVVHSFRSKNSSGALVLNSYEFILDKNYNIIEAKSIID